MKPIPKWLSKTKLLRGFRCLKYLYLTVNHPEWEAAITPELQALFDQGNEVGEAARRFFPGGVLIDNLPWDFSGALAKTRQLLSQGSACLYEAAFAYQGFYARTDILQHNPQTGRFRIFEVKSSTKVKPEQIEDAALQAWILAKSGLPLEQINLMHLNPDCRYPTLDDLFLTQDITAEVREAYPRVQPKIKAILESLKQENIPEIDIGPYCQSPNTCGFTAHCWEEKKIPAFSIFNLPGLKEKKWALYQQGIISVDDPRLSSLNPQQERMVSVFKTEKRFLDIPPIEKALAEWQFPLIFLDFETLNPAIPSHTGCRPFQQVPFQFSVHTWSQDNPELAHKEFLFDSASDPRPELIPALLQACGEKGSIVAYYADFEKARILELADFSPAHQNALLALEKRLVDPLPLLRNHVYDKAFGGSFSLKAVAPALLGEAQSYEGMAVADGSAAQRAYQEMIKKGVSADRKAALKEALLAYCKKDTEVLVDLVKWLFNLSVKA